MNRHPALPMTAVFVLAVVFGAGLFAHDGHEHKILGTVTMAAADHVMLRTADGKDMTIQVTEETKVTRGKQKLKAAEIEAGTRVVVTAVTDKGTTKAKVIQVGVRAKPPAK